MKVPPNHPRYDDLSPSYDPVDQLLDRLENVKPARGGWDASCPTALHVNGDRSRGLHVIRGRDDQAVMTCHAGCSTQEIIDTLGIEWKHLFPPRAPGMTPPRARRPKADPLPKQAVAAMLDASLAGPEFLLTWTVGRLLAVRHPIQAQRDLLLSWDYLNTLGVDVPLAWEWAKIIRSVAFWRYARAADNAPNPVERAVTRLLAELDRGV